MIQTEELFLKVERDLEQLKDDLEDEPKSLEEIANQKSWSEEKTRIYLKNLLERRIIFRTKNRKYSRNRIK